MNASDREQFVKALALLSDLRKDAWYRIKDGSKDYEIIGKVSTALIVSYEEYPS